MAPREALCELARGFIGAQASLDLDRMLLLRTPECVYTIGPSSQGRKPMDNASFAKTFGPILKLFESMRFEVHHTWVDVTSNVVILQAEGHGTTVGGPYDMEYVFVLHANDDASALCRIEEIIDTASSQLQRSRFTPS